MWLLCGAPWRRQPEGRADDAVVAHAESRRRVRDPEPKQRETLRKKKPAPPTAPKNVDISPSSSNAKPSAVELDSDVTSTVTSRVDIPDCAELPANPPAAGLLLKSEPVSPTSPPAQSTWIEKRSASLPGCPRFLVPGSVYIDSQAQQWHDPTPAATAAAAQLFRSVTSESLLESTFSDWQQSIATSPASAPAPFPSSPSSSSAGRSVSASTLPPLTPLTPISSRTSLQVAMPSGIASSNLPSEGVGTMNNAPAHDHRPRLGQLQPMRSSPRLLVRQSSGNIDQLLARHALLESRRQILLELHEVEQEQERIIEELAAMPEELADNSC